MEGYIPARASVEPLLPQRTKIGALKSPWPRRTLNTYTVKATFAEVKNHLVEELAPRVARLDLNGWKTVRILGRQVNRPGGAPARRVESERHVAAYVWNPPERRLHFNPAMPVERQPHVGGEFGDGP